MMASTSTGHRADVTRPGKVHVDRDLWLECRALRACWEGKLPAYIGSVGEFDVYVIDGNKTMTEHDADYVSGGNHYEDPELCEPNEIVLDNLNNPSDFPFVAVHEVVEARLMRDKGYSYTRAHAEANRQEMHLRRLSGGVPCKVPIPIPTTVSGAGNGRKRSL